MTAAATTTELTDFVPVFLGFDTGRPCWTGAGVGLADGAIGDGEHVLSFPDSLTVVVYPAEQEHNVPSHDNPVNVGIKFVVHVVGKVTVLSGASKINKYISCLIIKVKFEIKLKVPANAVF